MKRISRFFTSLVRSLSDPRFFSDVIKTRSLFSLFFFTGVTLLTGLLGVVKLKNAFLELDLAAYPQEFLEVIPPELALTFSSDGLEINQSLPYTIPLPESWQSEADDVTSLVEFASGSANLSAATVASSSALAIITPTDIYVPERDENLSSTPSVKVYAVPGVTNPITLTRDSLEQQLTNLIEQPLIRGEAWAWTLSTVIVMLWWPWVWLYRLIVITILASVFWILTRCIKKWQVFSFGEIFKASLVFSTLPLLVVYGFEWLHLSQYQGLAFWFVGLGWLAVGAHFSSQTVPVGPAVASPAIRTHSVRKRANSRRVNRK